jgi:hypothetical protein
MVRTPVESTAWMKGFALRSQKNAAKGDIRYRRANLKDLALTQGQKSLE